MLQQSIMRYLTLFFFIGSQKLEKERNAGIELNGKCQNPQDIKNFDTLVGLI